MPGKARKTIAIICGNAISSYSTELMEGFQACAKEEDVNLVFLTGPHIPRYCRDILTGSFAWDYDYQFHAIYNCVHYIKPDAIIVAYGLLSQFKYVPDINEFVKGFEGIPYLVLGDKVEDPNVPYLTGGNYHGMKENVEHLIHTHGYKKIGFVAGPERNFDSNQRLQAYKDAMAEAGLPVPDTYVVHGTYAEVADAEVECLLDNHPDLEAIVFANDMMAKAGYRVCATRDLVVGHDIAITGYDDGDVAKSLEPPLTSVAHSSFLFSYKAVQAALKLCRGEVPESVDLEAQFHGRASCGCKAKTYSMQFEMDVKSLKNYTEKRVATMTEELFSAVPYEKDKTKYRMLLELYFSDVIDMVFANEKQEDVSFELLLRYVKRMCENTFVSKRLLLEYITDILMELVDFSENKWKQTALMSILTAMQQYIHSEELNSLNMEIIRSDRKNWFIPSFTMDLINSKLGMQDQMAHIMKRLQAMGVKSSYLLFYANNVVHKRDEQMQYPDKIYLTAHYDERKMVCYGAKELIEVKWDEGFTDLLPQDRPHFYTAFPLFSGEEQYGMIMCEADQSEYMFMLICSMQLGSLRSIINMNLRERAMQQELEEKNRILSVISAYDELSQLLNRRGFMEKAIDIIKKNIGKKACMVFADIDHLKEINDCFGHAAGDFAIKTASNYLRQCMPPNAAVARIGGDEYVALVVLEDTEECECDVLTKRLEKRARDFNKSCTEPFYIEMSAGLYSFTCEKNTDIPEILKKSDEVLYEKKKNRRATIKKAVREEE
ncbi:MAG: GGDEF domain-containing protein [Roseburia sp.]|nr:GGDEF domain-containing protein [Roseburia sp.]